jgi:hypothetical protein
LINSYWDSVPTGTIDLSTQSAGLHLFESVASLNKVHVYQNINYAGFYSQLSTGNFTLAQLQARGISDNDITSLTVPSGYVVTVYENDNFGGASKIFIANSAWLADWNDRISSLKIVDTNFSLVNLYQDVTFGGYTSGLNVGDYTLAQLQAKGILDNDITSLKITEGYKVIVYDGDNFTGASKEFTATADWAGDWNDRTTSLRIRPNGTAALGNKTYYLQNRNSGLYMDVWGLSTADGGNIAQGNYTGANNQQFKFIDAGDGAYQIQAINSGKSVDIAGVSTDNGANVHQWSYVGAANQQFIAVSTGDGYYKLVAKHSGKLVEVAGFSTVSGGNVQQWENANQSSGQWKLITIGTLKLAKSTSETKIEAETINVYPNPAENTLFFTTEMTGTQVSIFSSAGSSVSQQKITNNNINVSDLPSGIYFIVFEKDGTKITKRFIKK